MHYLRTNHSLQLLKCKLFELIALLAFRYINAIIRVKLKTALMLNVSRENKRKCRLQLQLSRLGNKPGIVSRRYVILTTNQRRKVKVCYLKKKKEKKKKKKKKVCGL
ncbi:hypothetical protein PUN28_000324 [Cardiocondyla obscurior]|uniref:Ribosomal protein L34 n=1 Tax=Cardiocondyla obscurior TaxID=286306 RepID=A0AAW2GZ83_9HYME